MKMFWTEENINSLLSRFPMLMLEFGELPAIAVIKIDNAIHMLWTSTVDPHAHHSMQEENWLKVLQARLEVARLEKEMVAELRGAVVADMCGDPHRSHRLRKKARNLEITKPPAFVLGLEDNSPPIHKPYFDLLIGIENELLELEEKHLKLSHDGNLDKEETLAKEHDQKISRFRCIIEGVVAKLIHEDMWFEPLAVFFRRVDPIMMGCDECFDPLNIVPHEWGLPAKIINFLHMEMLLLHWLHASLVPREHPAPPLFMAGTVEYQNVPRLVFDIYLSQWNIVETTDQTNQLLNFPSGGSMPLSTSSRKRSREEDLI